MATFLDVQNNIADYLNRSDLTTQIKTAINRAIASYGTHDFWFTQAGPSTFSTIANQESYAVADGIPDNIREITYLRLTSGGSFYRIDPRTLVYIQEHNPNSNPGMPFNYCFWAKKIYLNPIPDAVYTVTAWFRKTYAEMTLNADTNDFTTNIEALNLIEAKACWWLSSYIIRDKEGAAEYQEMESNALAILSTIGNNLQATERLYPTDF